MTRRHLLATFGSAALGPQLLRGQGGDSLGAARDLLYQALEILHPSANDDQVTRAIRLLKAAMDQNPSFGDAHYYRALCLKRLKQTPGLQKSDLEAAELYHSEALRDGRDPFLLAVPKIDRNLAGVGQKWALVVGLSNFQPRVGAPRLPAAAADAEAFTTLLKDPVAGRFPANQVFLLKDEQATGAGIKSRLNYIATRAKPEDVVVVYFSTHGSARAQDLRQVSYLYTYDTDVTAKDQIFATALGMPDISMILNSRCVAQRTLIIFDTCHSGASIPAERLATQALSAQDIDRFREGAGRYILTACQDDQQAYEDGGHGYFTASLIDRWRANKGCMHVQDLFQQVKGEVSSKVKRKYGKDQNPVMAASRNSLEFALGAAPASANADCAVA